MDSTDDQGQAALPVTAGGRLRSAREAAGLSRSDIASRTKIAERHLLAIEENRFADLAARTYAVGFARAYARALGLDEAEIAALVRGQLDAEDIDRPVTMPSFEPGDPARVPPVRVAWLAGGGAIIVIIALLVFWSSFLSPQGKLPDLLPTQTHMPVASAPAQPPRAQPRSIEGQVVLTATDDNVWLEITDAAGTKLLEKTLAKGESWTVPAGAQGPRLRTGRPDALQLAVGGKAIAPLSDRPTTVTGVSLVASDLLARANPAAGQSASPPQQNAARPGTPRQVTEPAQPAPRAIATPAAPASADPGRPARKAASTPSMKPVAKPPADPAGVAPTPGTNAAASPAPGPSAQRPAGATQPVSTTSN